MRKLSPIASFSAVSAPQPHLAAQDPRSTVPFLFRTNKPHKINILSRAVLKTKEKQFSIQYKFAVGSIGPPAAEGLPAAGRPMLPIILIFRVLRLARGRSRRGRLLRRSRLLRRWARSDLC